MISASTTNGQVIRDANGENIIDFTNNQFNKFRRVHLEDSIVDGLCQYIDALPLKWETSGFGPEQTVNSDVRMSEHAWIDDEDVQRFMYSNISTANQDRDWNFDLNKIERVQYTKYQPGGHYKLHNDSLMSTEEPRQVRKLSCILVLNDDFEEGLFQFCKIEDGEISRKDLELRKGDMIVFPSFCDHRVKPITSGERKVLVAWAWGPLFK